MPLIYGLVARGSVVLCEHAITTGNFGAITQHILDKISPQQDSRMTYVYDKYLFHYMVRGGLTYLCLADEEFGRRIPFAFLDDLQQKFVAANQDKAKTALSFGLQEYARAVEQLMAHYSDSANVDKFKRLQGEVDQVKGIMVSNIERVLERGERIDILVDKTEELSQASFAFKKRSTALRRAMWWKNTRLLVLLGCASVFVVYFIVSYQCGFPGWHNCVGSSKG